MLRAGILCDAWHSGLGALQGSVCFTEGLRDQAFRKIHCPQYAWLQERRDSALDAQVGFA